MKIKTLCNYIMIVSLVSFTCGCSNSISVVENNTRVSASKLNSLNNFQISIRTLKSYMSENSKIKNSNDSKMIYSNLEIIKLIKSILKNPKTKGYSDNQISRLMGVDVYKVVGNKNLRIIQYKTDAKVYGENNVKTYQFTQDIGNDENEVSLILNGENKEYNKFFQVKFNGINKLLCIGNDYSINSKRAVVTVYDNSQGTYNIDDDIINPVDDINTKWNINMIDSTINIGNALEESTYVSNIYENGKEVEIRPTEECVRYLGYNPGIFKMKLKDEYGYVPIIQ